MVNVVIKEFTKENWTLMPCHPDVCQECATAHSEEEPHNAQSLHYQYKFRLEHGRFPTWDDAISHCSNELKSLWIKELKKMGVNVNG